MDEKSFLLLVKALAFIAVVISVGWLLSFVIVPAFNPDFQPQPEVTVAMTAIITAIAGLLTSVYFKSKRPRDEDKDGPDGDGNDH
ncbi:hypothetical protein ACIBCD_26830 [Nocardia brasiliensis]|uniref:hypothetical protein n=1 Tax=Nocardia brasiliensis TaxID=37326 RepID=UPI0037ABC55E